MSGVWDYAGLYIILLVVITLSIVGFAAIVMKDRS